MNAPKIIFDTIINITSLKSDLVYIVEPSDWSIRWDGKYISGELNRQNLIKSSISRSRFLLRNKILHFGSHGTLIKQNGIKDVHSSNKTVLSWYHIGAEDNALRCIPDLNNKADFVHTSCAITKEKLIAFGLNPEKIVIVPIGIDLKIFKPFIKEEKEIIRKKLQLPEKKIIIGSFQKDGAGWSAGLVPKYIKGPDIFCDVVEKLAKNLDIHVLLSGPARGFVIKRLQQAGISYTHRFLKNYPEIVNFYNAIDLYLVSSRAEGGPKAITESMACGIPIVSTKVGMAPEIIKNGENGLISEIDNISSLSDNCMRIIGDENFKNKLIKNALADVQNYNWEITTKDLYDKIYHKLKN
jgi:glycosyltransferase involved in cell wall biosynthesis